MDLRHPYRVQGPYFIGAASQCQDFVSDEVRPNDARTGRPVVEVALNRFADVVAHFLDRLRLGVNAVPKCAGGVSAIDFVITDLEDDLGTRRRHNHLPTGACYQSL